jgi:hypothetical protein
LAGANSLTQNGFAIFSLPFSLRTAIVRFGRSRSSSEGAGCWVTRAAPSSNSGWLNGFGRNVIGWSPIEVAIAQRSVPRIRFYEMEGFVGR